MLETNDINEINKVRKSGGINFFSGKIKSKKYMARQENHGN